MTNLTKDEVRKLAPAQQEALATMELQRMRMKRELVERARGRRGIGMIVVEGLLVAVPCGLAMLSIAIPRLLPFAVIAVSCEVGFYVAGLNRRLDACGA